MKRTFAKQGLLSLVAGFFLFGFLLLSANRAEAQASWMQPDQAKQVLLSEVNTITGDLQALTPGMPDYKDKLAHVIYYRTIYNNIQGGLTVENSTTEALTVFSGNTNPRATQIMVDAGLTVSKAAGQLLYNQAVGLLTL